MVDHCVLQCSGEVFAIGKNTDNVLGLGTWLGQDDKAHWRYDQLQRVHFPAEKKIAGVHASLSCSIAWTEEGRLLLFVQVQEVVGLVLVHVQDVVPLILV